MRTSNDRLGMKDKLLVCLWAVFLTLATFASGLFSWFTPLPLFYIGRKYTIRHAILGWFAVLGIVACAYASFLLPDLKMPLKPEWFTWLPAMLYYKDYGSGVVLKALIVYFSFSISLSLLLITLSQKEKEASRFMSRIAMGTSLATALAFVVCMGPQNLNAFVALIQQYTLSVLNQILALNQSSGSMSGDELIYIQQNKEMLATSFVRLLPGLALSATLFLIWVNVYVARRLFNVFGYFDRLQSMIFFKLSFQWVWAVVLSLGIFLLNLYVLKLDWISFVLFNFLIVFATLYFFQGMAILAFLFLARQVAVWWRLLTYFLLIVFFQPLGLLVMGLGFFDAWYDFRKFNAPKGAST